MRTLTSAQLRDYFVLAARVLLAYTFISYGYAKLNDGQFGLAPAQLALPVQQLGLFKLSWYLFGQEPFKSFVGYSQVLAGLLCSGTARRCWGPCCCCPSRPTCWWWT